MVLCFALQFGRDFIMSFSVTSASPNKLISTNMIQLVTLLMCDVREVIAQPRSRLPDDQPWKHTTLFTGWCISLAQVLVMTALDEIVFELYMQQLRDDQKILFSVSFLQCVGCTCNCYLCHRCNRTKPLGKIGMCSSDVPHIWMSKFVFLI